MVRRHLATRGITDRRVLAVMAAIPREHFLPPYLRDQAYADMPLPIGYDQTISQPYIVALMTQEAELTRQSAVLEIGTGTGYHTAVLARIARHVWTVERLEALSRRATRRLDHLAVRNVTFVTGDGALGYPDAGPYDAVVVTAAAPGAPPSLLHQLAVGGKMVIPIGDEGLQQLTVIDRAETGYRERDVAPCRFVPLISKDAFSE
jgi:protein-L-isoaspartate(D-aspartate) O-methyltransferase